MFSVTTAEIRWFLPGALPANLLNWLSRQEGTFDDQPVRNDLYLLLPAQEDLGIKLREGRMEFKKRTAVNGEFISKTLSGNVETWVKWSIEAGESIRPDLPHFSDPKHWISIEKKRYLQKYAISPEGELHLPPPAGYPEKGIAVELSDLRMKGSAWWTFGLECFGKPEDVYKDLLSHISRLSAGYPEADPGQSRSLGYPAWISRNAR